MCSTYDSGQGHGSSGAPQGNIEELMYPAQEAANESNGSQQVPPKYTPTAKHGPGGHGSPDPIKTDSEGQHLLETGVKDGKQVYNVTDDKKVVKFQPANTPTNEYHSYEVSNPRDIPTKVLRDLLEKGKITKSDYNKLRKGKKL